MPQSQWFYVKDGQQAGPVSLADLQQLLASGVLSPQDLIWREGMAQWQPASTFPGVCVPVAPPPLQTPPITVAAPYAGYAPYPAPAGESSSGLAIAGFVLSLTFAPLGLIFSAIALSKMRRTGNIEGKGFAVAGLCVSLVFCGIWCIVGMTYCSCLAAILGGGGRGRF